ncbi:hypothetical protein Dimus_032862 [Dionaea muscipula]
MADELIQGAAGICDGGSWWSNPNPMLGFFSGGCGLPSSPCTAALDMSCDFGWLNEIKDKQPLAAAAYYFCDLEAISVIDDSSVITTHETHHPLPPPSPSLLLPPPQQLESGGACGSAAVVDSSLEMMGFGLSPSSSSTDWNQQTFIGGDEARNEKRNHEYYSTFIQKDWMITSKDDQYFTSCGMKNSGNSSMDSTTSTKCDGHSGLSPPAAAATSSSSYALMIQSLLIEPDIDDDDDGQLHQPQEVSSLLFEDYQRILRYDSNDPLHRASQQLDDHSSDMLLSPALITDSYLINTSLIDNNNTTAGNSLIDDPRGIVLNTSLSSSSSTAQTTFNHNQRPHSPNLKAKKKNTEKVRGLGSNITTDSKNNEPSFKKPRIETPSPLPTFKVRKEKLGDRITALQQLVSPFGKTDTASVLHEAIEYIKFLHDQVNGLSTQHLTNGAPMQHRQENNTQVSQQDLSSKGLCLVPISFTFPVAHETPVDFWTPTFGLPPTPFR